MKKSRCHEEKIKSHPGSPLDLLQFILDASVHPEIITLKQNYGDVILKIVFHLTRTWCFEKYPTLFHKVDKTWYKFILLKHRSNCNQDAPNSFSHWAGWPLFQRSTKLHFNVLYQAHHEDQINNQELQAAFFKNLILILIRTLQQPHVTQV